MKYAKWRQRLRGTCKWSGVTLCVFLLAIWVPSRSHLFVAAIGPVPGGAGQIGIACGSVWYSADHVFPPFALEERSDRWLNLNVRPLTPRFYWRLWSLSYDPPRVGVPLWALITVVVLPTGWLFWSDHRRRMRGGAGCCAQCGYSLTGNTSGKCPECGATTTARAAT